MTTTTNHELITSKPLDRNALKQLALAATPGPWEATNNERDGDDDEYWDIDSNHGTIVGDEGIWFPPEKGSNAANAQYIAAANPDTLLRLLERIDAQARAIKCMQSALSDAQASINKVTREGTQYDAMDIAETLSGIEFAKKMAASLPQD